MNIAKSVKPGFWRRSHYLDRMTLGELVVAYFQHYAILVYLGVAAGCTYVALTSGLGVARLVVAGIFPPLVYPLVWYALHRWVLHSNWMFKVPFLAATWKRIHYDHHQDPNHLEVLFGALYTTLPTIFLATAPLGYAIGGIGGGAMAFATGLAATCFYEFCHCIQHLSYKPRSARLMEMKLRHMEHHFHDENGNFGITNFVWDKLLGTYYHRPDRPRKSPKVFNLGYTEDVAVHYPRVKDLSGGIIATGHPRQRSKQQAA